MNSFLKFVILCGIATLLGMAFGAWFAKVNGWAG